MTSHWWNRVLFGMRPLRAASLSRKQAKRTKRKHCRRAPELLEDRSLCAADLRTFDGTGNNLQHTQWGSTDEAFLRMSPAAYADGVSSAAGQDRPSARAISNIVAAQGDQDIVNDRDLSAFVYAWGQFLDHDIDLTNAGAAKESLPIAVPKGDQYFDPLATGTQTIGLTRSSYDPASGTSKANPRQQVNAITAFIDASQVYGSTAETAASLRTFQGGQLKTSAGNLLPMDATASSFLAGDIRVNENVELTAMQTLFMREHNRLAAAYAKTNPAWTDEQLYQAARRWVAGEMQVITYNEFLPAILGQNALSNYRGYNAQVNPGIANEFATAAFRFGHSMLGDDVEFLDNQGNAVHPEVALRDAFFAPQLVRENGIDEIFKYLASDRAQEIDPHVIDDVRNFLFGPPGAGGLDLAALNIQRGRDHGLSSYNAVRVAYGMKPAATFAEITKDSQLQKALKDAYGDVNKVDLWVGGLSEDHVPGASMGPLFQRIVADQFQRLRDGDRFWHERDFKGAELDQLRRTTLSDVVKRNTTTWNLQANVFQFKVELAGRVVADGNRDGRLNSNEAGLPGVTVQLRDADDNLVASVVTDRNGLYRFAGLELGTYKVKVVAPAGLMQTTRELPPVEITKGVVVERLDVGLARSLTAPTTPPRPGTPAPPPRQAAAALDSAPASGSPVDLPIGTARVNRRRG